MPNEFPMNDPRNIWQKQPTEAFKMSADQLRHKAEKRKRTARFSVLYSIVISVILFVILARELATVPEWFSPLVLGPLSLWSIRIGLGLLCLWSIYFPYWAFRRIWPGRLTPDATLNTTVQSYRSELERQRDYGRNTWVRGGLAFAFFGMAMVMVPMVMVRVPVLIKATPVTGPRLLLDVAPFLLLAMAWAVMFYMRNRSRQKLQQEIEQLHAFERENPAS